ncbi:MAG: iron-binding protein, partial [Thermus sp.]
MKIELRENGPLVIRGARIRIQVGEKEEIREGAVALCRCGGSE